MRPDAPLLLNLHRKAFSTYSLMDLFRSFCRKAGIYKPRRVEDNVVRGGTTPHAMRHSFVVHRILRWYRDGVNVNSKLMLLSTYVGHAHYFYTQRYMTVVPELVDIARKAFADGYERPLKELEWPAAR
jgi:integrase